MSDNPSPTVSSFHHLYLYLSFVINEQAKYRLRSSSPIEFASTSEVSYSEATQKYLYDRRIKASTAELFYTKATSFAAIIRQCRVISVVKQRAAIRMDTTFYQRFSSVNRLAETNSNSALNSIQKITFYPSTPGRESSRLLVIESPSPSGNESVIRTSDK